MREGAWLNALTGSWSWITEHASWIQNPENARSLGMDDKTHARLAAIPWDHNGPGRKAILLVAMNIGFIRVRGHGQSTTFEFTLPMETAIMATVPFMEQHFGPLSGCRFNDLKAGKSLGIAYGELQAVLEGAATMDLAALSLKNSEPFNDSE
jgi:hypothetical protein